MMSSPHVADHQVIEPTDLESRCDLLRSLHIPGTPLVLPNAWDIASARAVEAAGFPVVATTSGGVAASLGYEDHERAPGDEMLGAGARIATGVNVPVTVDAEAGYGDGAHRSPGQAEGDGGRRLQPRGHRPRHRWLRDPVEQADWLRAVRGAASDQGYGLVINARIDVFLSALASGAEGKRQAETLLGPEWPKASMRVLRNRVVNEWAGRESEVPLIPPRSLVIGRTRFAGLPYPMPKLSAILPTRDTRGDFEEMAMMDEVPPAAEIVRGLVG
jgi:hypothetical protein